MYLKDFKLNTEGSFSITKPYESAQIIQLMEAFIKRHEPRYLGIDNMTITDATSCMGGDLIRFSKSFYMVNGVEIREDNYELLVQNIQHFDCKNVSINCDDYLNIYDKLQQDVIYIDAPWNGPEYKSKKSVVLKLGDTEVSKLINSIRDKKLSRYIFLKAPSNVCLNDIIYETIHTIYNKSRVESFKLICIVI